jgi:LysM repeat protein
MSQPDRPASNFGHERVCPHCGTRVAQKADTCFFCGGSLNSPPRLRRSIPWADIILFVFIGALVVFWWMNAPNGQNGQQVAQLATPDAGVAPASVVTGTPTAVAPRPTITPIPDTPTSTPTSPPEPTKTLVPTPVRHKVQSGESFGIIADKYGSTVKDIVEANGLTSDAIIHPGDELIVPVAGPSGGPGPTPTPSGGTLLYSVQPGDTISDIAERFGSRMDWILDANKRKPNDMLRPGDRLLIPLSNLTPTPTQPATPTVVSTPSITPEAMLRTPILLSPTDQALLRGDSEVLLRWASSAVLAKEQWYVVTVKIAGSDALVAPYWTKGTVWRLPPDYRTLGSDATRFSWSVQVVEGTPNQEVAKPVSPLSETRTFTWTK